MITYNQLGTEVISTSINKEKLKSLSDKIKKLSLSYDRETTNDFIKEAKRKLDINISGTTFDEDKNCFRISYFIEELSRICQD